MRRYICYFVEVILIFLIAWNSAEQEIQKKKRLEEVKAFNAEMQSKRIEMEISQEDEFKDKLNEIYEEFHIDKPSWEVRP